METLQGFDFYPIEFTKDGQVFAPGQVQALLAGLKARAATDLLVLAHGWNNDMADARALYGRLLAQLRHALDARAVPAVAPRVFAVLGALWPSKKFADVDVIPSGAAGAASPITTALLTAALERLRGVFDAPDADQKIDAAQGLLPKLEDSPAARDAFAALLRALVPSTETSPDVDASGEFRRLPGRTLIDHLAKPLPAAVLGGAPAAGPGAAGPGAHPGAEGHVAGLGQFFGGIKAGALNLLNYTTYYQMKERAGRVGRDGLRGVLQAARQQQPALKLHLAGHSFGGRVATAAAAGPDGGATGAPPALPIDSLTLLQAAFSHYGFSDNYDGSHPGFFRPVLSKHAVRGPILITHSAHDAAVGTMYPLASMLAQQVASALGDAHDKYGGMGRNGAQKTPEAAEGPLLGVGGGYAFAPGKVFNLNADAIIQDHSDICHPEVAYALLQAVATT